MGHESTWVKIYCSPARRHLRLAYYKDKQAYPCTALLLNHLRLIPLVCSDRLDYEMLDSIDELSPCQEENSAPVFLSCFPSTVEQGDASDDPTNAISCSIKLR